jgi:large subunit ribosomal protein LP1
MLSQSDKILALTTAAGVDIEPIWATLLSKALEGKNVKEMLSTIGVSSGPAAPDAATASTQDTAAKPVEDTAPASDDGNDSDDSDDMVRAPTLTHYFPLSLLMIIFSQFGGGLFD